MKAVGFICLVFVGAILAAGVFIHSGIYPIGADVPHSKFTHRLLETLRERSIARAAKDIVVPDLNSPELLLAGGPDYNEMCAICHLQPGRKQSDMSIGLYPPPPNLSAGHDAHRHDHGSELAQSSARRQFWIIKHGIKASGMPAWGPTHDDQRIWAIVAFLQRLPTLDADQYQILTVRDEVGEQPHH